MGTTTALEAPQVNDRFELTTCPHCCGEGHTLRSIRVYERGCGFAHDDVDEVRCEECNGAGEFISEYELED